MCTQTFTLPRHIVHRIEAVLCMARSCADAASQTELSELPPRGIRLWWSGGLSWSPAPEEHTNRRWRYCISRRVGPLGRPPSHLVEAARDPLTRIARLDVETAVEPTCVIVLWWDLRPDLVGLHYGAEGALAIRERLPLNWDEDDTLAVSFADHRPVSPQIGPSPWTRLAVLSTFIAKCHTR